jgi:hypothetical protein
MAEHAIVDIGLVGREISLLHEISAMFLTLPQEAPRRKVQAA